MIPKNVLESFLADEDFGIGHFLVCVLLWDGDQCVNSYRESCYLVRIVGINRVLSHHSPTHKRVAYFKC